MSDEPDRDLLAAEFVLGSLEGAERGEAERLLAADPAFARSVAAWQQRLTPLAAHIAPVAPPAGLWRSIEASIDPPATANIRPVPSARAVLAGDDRRRAGDRRLACGILAAASAGAGSRGVACAIVRRSRRC